MEQTNSRQNGVRFLYAAVGLVVLLFAGFVYGWSIFAAPIGADFPAWSKAQLSLTFTICMAFFLSLIHIFLEGHIMVKADLVIKNGKIATVDRNFSYVEAVACRNGYIIDRGANAEICLLYTSHRGRGAHILKKRIGGADKQHIAQIAGHPGILVEAALQRGDIRLVGGVDITLHYLADAFDFCIRHCNLLLNVVSR